MSDSIQLSSTANQTTAAASERIANAPAPVDKGKGKARAIEPEEDDEEDDDEDEDEDEDLTLEEEDSDLDEAEDFGGDDGLDPSVIISSTRRRTTRGQPIDYSSAEAHAKAGFQDGGAPEGKGAAAGAADEEEEDDEEFKDEEMED